MFAFGGSAAGTQLAMQKTGAVQEDDSNFWDSASDFAGGVVDTFSSLADGYLKFRLAEKQADATGASQAALANTVETNNATGRQPLSSGQYNGVQTQNAANAQGGFNLGNLDQNTLMIGAAVVGVILLLKR